MCEHCDAVNKVLKDLLGFKVASVIGKRVREEVHGRDMLKGTENDLERKAVELEPAGSNPTGGQ